MCLCLCLLFRTSLEFVGPSPVPLDLLMQQQQQQFVPPPALPLLVRLSILSESHLLSCAIKPQSLDNSSKTATAAARDSSSSGWTDLTGTSEGSFFSMSRGAARALGLVGGLPYDLVGLLLYGQLRGQQVTTYFWSSSSSSESSSSSSICVRACVCAF